MAVKAGNNASGNWDALDYYDDDDEDYKMSPSVKYLAELYDIRSKKFSIELIRINLHRMRPHIKRRALWTIKCLQFELPFDLKRWVDR